MRTDVGIGPRLSESGPPAALLAIVALAVAVRFVPDTLPLAAAARLVAAGLAVGFVPGALVALTVRPIMPMSLPQLAAFGVALSFVVVQGLTATSLLLHLPAAWMAAFLLAVSAVGAAALLWRGGGDGTARWELGADEAAVGLLIAGVAALLYFKGSPFFSYEDHLHVGMVRRLAWLPRPAMDGVYSVPGVVYTYPLPGTHFLMALVSAVSGLDALFVYHKIRFLWGGAALLILYVAASRVFESRRLGMLTVLTAGALVLSGAFTDVPALYWGQLAPMSHPSDVAMGVILPGLLLLALHYLGEEARRARWALFWATLAMAATMAMVHIREIVQFVVYLACFTLAAWLLAREPMLAARAALLLLGTVAVTVVYVLFHRIAVPHVTIQDMAGRRELLEAARALPLKGWLSRPLPVVGSLGSMFYGWNPLVILAAPLLWVALRDRALMHLVGMSMLVYLLVIRLPVLTLPYVYLTYWEILITPVRNLAFFVYLLAGVGLYLLAVALARLPSRPVALAGAVIAGTAVAAAAAHGGGWLESHRDILFGPGIAMFAAAIVLLRGPRAARWGRALLPASPSPAWRSLFALLLLPSLAWPAVPASSPLSIRSVSTAIPPFPATMRPAHIPRALFEELPCIESPPGTLLLRRLDGTVTRVPEGVRSCPMNWEVARWAASTLPADAVLVTNAWNVWAPSVFIPQHVLSSLPSRSGVDARLIYRDYYARFERALVERGVQPLFNDSEPLDARLDFVRALRITHVLVDPMYYHVMKAALGRWPEGFRLVYDDGQWAVYEVVARQAAGRLQS
jgi:hypothetical protein